MEEKNLFGPASLCQNLVELIQLQRKVVGDEARSAVVAYGMLLAARSAPDGKYFDDAVEVLNCLGAAKAQLDKAIYHSTPTVLVTAEILSTAQNFLKEMTVPCTEWPMSAEVVACVYTNAIKYSFAGPWKVSIYASSGVVIGSEILRDF